MDVDVALRGVRGRRWSLTDLATVATVTSVATIACKWQVNGEGRADTGRRAYRNVAAVP